jgi:hypothetical protein
VLGERIMARKEQLKQEIAGGNLPAPQTRSFSGHKLVQDNPVARSREIAVPAEFGAAA